MYITNLTIDRIMPQRQYAPLMANYSATLDSTNYRDISTVSFDTSYKINIEAYLENDDMPHTQDLIGKQIELKKFIEKEAVPDLVPDKKAIEEILKPKCKKLSSINYIKLEEK